MSCETAKPPSILEQTLLPAALRDIKQFATEEFVRLLLPVIEHRLVKTMVPELPAGFEDAFREQMKDPKTVPILTFSHQGHADLITGLVVTKSLTDLANETGVGRSQGYLMPVAASLRAGKQGEFLRQCLIQTEEDYLPKYPLIFADIVRQKDIDKYGMAPNKIAFIARLEETIRKGYGVAMFPEESVEAGRHRDGENDDAIKGMQEINNNHLNTIISVALHCGYRVLLIPVASRGAHKITDSNPDRRTGAPANRITLRELKLLLGKDAPKLISATLGMPIKIDHLVGFNNRGKSVITGNIAELVGKRMAALLPENERGVYA